MGREGDKLWKKGGKTQGDENGWGAEYENRGGTTVND